MLTAARDDLPIALVMSKAGCSRAEAERARKEAADLKAHNSRLAGKLGYQEQRLKALAGGAADAPTDEGPRADTSLSALAKLKPVFHAQGTVTAGNSSQTSDGAAGTIWTPGKGGCIFRRPLYAIHELTQMFAPHDHRLKWARAKGVDLRLAGERLSPKSKPS